MVKHSLCEAWSSKCFFDVVMKVLMFIELVSGVKYPKITTVGFFEATICGCFVFVPFFFCFFSFFEMGNKEKRMK